MEEKITADNALNGFSDISGVKNADGSDAEIRVSHNARLSEGAVSETASSEAAAEPTGDVRRKDVLPESDSASLEANGEDLDAEFEALIKGKYRRAYQKRMENTVRRRLKNGRARSVSEAKPYVREEGSVSCEKTENVTVAEVAARGSEDVTSDMLIEVQKSLNRSRPTENGVGGSVGIVTRINVSTLSGSDILGIIHRAETGEKITF